MGLHSIENFAGSGLDLTGICPRSEPKTPRVRRRFHVTRVLRFVFETLESSDLFRDVAIHFGCFEVSEVFVQ